MDKFYTSIEQSKKLAEILPLESADMLFQLGEDKYADSIRVPLTNKHWEQMMPDINPCWSLAALLDVLPNYQLQTQDNDIGLLCSKEGKFNIVSANSPIDCCYEMILKLHKQKLI